MKRVGFISAAVVALGVSLGLGSAEATIVVGGYNFDDNAFADELVSSFGTFSLGGVGTLEDQLVGSNVNDWAFSETSGAYVRLGFTDNAIVNGSGADLALFELGVPGRLTLTIGGTEISYSTVGTGFSGGGFNLNVALIDLSDFGLGAGSSLSEIHIGMDETDQGLVPSLTAAGALNSTSVPEPGMLLLLGTGAATLLARRRRNAV